MNHQHPKIKFTSEVDKNNNFRFLALKPVGKPINLGPLFSENLPLVVCLLILIVLYQYHTNIA